MLSRVALLYGVRKVGRGTLCVGDSFGSVSCREAVKIHFTSLHDTAPRDLDFAQDYGSSGE